MSDFTRRTFVKAVGSALPVVAVPAAAAAETASQPPARALDAALLRALAPVVLPGELGEAGVERAVVGFERWLGAYEPVAEENHGYGTSELSYLPPDPAPGWDAQLRALELEARRRHGRGFAELDMDARSVLVTRQLASERGERLPAAHAARHVAIGLLSWWAAQPDAADLAYRARIGKETCRALESVRERPAPIADGA